MFCPSHRAENHPNLREHQSLDALSVAFITPSAAAPPYYDQIFAGSPSSDLLRISSKVQSFNKTPFLKTSTNKSLPGSPAPSHKVVIVPPCLTNLSWPFFDILPLSVIGSLYTFRAFPFTTA